MMLINTMYNVNFDEKPKGGQNKKKDPLENKIKQTLLKQQHIISLYLSGEKNLQKIREKVSCRNEVVNWTVSYWKSLNQIVLYEGY